MPISNMYEIFEEEIRIGVWKVTESLSDLQSKIVLSQIDGKRFQSRRKTVNKKTFLASRILLLEMNVDLRYLYYKSDVIPCLSNGIHISISHTNLFVVVALCNKKRVGIDIEEYQSRIINLSSKFLNPLDTKPHKEDCLVKHHTKIWSAKEAMFKACQKKYISFDKQMRVSLSDDYRYGKGTILYEKKTIEFKLFFSEIENHNLCISVSL